MNERTQSGRSRQNSSSRAHLSAIANDLSSLPFFFSCVYVRDHLICTHGNIYTHTQTRRRRRPMAGNTNTQTRCPSSDMRSSPPYVCRSDNVASAPKHVQSITHAEHVRCVFCEHRRRCRRRLRLSASYAAISRTRFVRTACLFLRSLAERM